MKQFKIKQTITRKDGETLNKYLADISKIGMMTPEQEAEVAKKAKTGDQQALNKLVESNLRFVISVAKQYQNQGMTLEDLINEGNIGLIKASQKFDETKGYKFISYAIHWIRQSIMYALAENSRTIRIPLNKVNSMQKIRKAAQDLEQFLEREPTADEISAVVDIESEKVAHIISSASRMMSLDTPFKHGEDEEGTLLDIIPSAETKSVDYTALEDEVKKVLSVLNERERLIITKYYGLGDEKPHTLEEIGDLFPNSLSRERIRQIKLKALRKLRISDRNKVLKNFIRE